MDLSSWFFKVRNVFQLSGFADVWLFTESVNVNFYTRVKQETPRDVHF